MDVLQHNPSNYGRIIATQRTNALGHNQTSETFETIHSIVDRFCNFACALNKQAHSLRVRSMAIR